MNFHGKGWKNHEEKNWKILNILLKWEWYLFNNYGEEKFFRPYLKEHFHSNERVNYWNISHLISLVYSFPLISAMYNTSFIIETWLLRVAHLIHFYCFLQSVMFSWWENIHWTICMVAHVHWSLSNTIHLGYWLLNQMIVTLFVILLQTFW